MGFNHEHGSSMGGTSDAVDRYWKSMGIDPMLPWGTKVKMLDDPGRLQWAVNNSNWQRNLKQPVNQQWDWPSDWGPQPGGGDQDNPLDVSDPFEFNKAIAAMANAGRTAQPATQTPTGNTNASDLLSQIVSLATGNQTAQAAQAPDYLSQIYSMAPSPIPWSQQTGPRFGQPQPRSKVGVKANGNTTLTTALPVLPAPTFSGSSRSVGVSSPFQTMGIAQAPTQAPTQSPFSAPARPPSGPSFQPQPPWQPGGQAQGDLSPAGYGSISGVNGLYRQY